ncbi:hypothetical protein [Novosphingobium sp. TH158]|uniref:hypothetical protein n=1 Tax=Novosphingobium sp. TH158 TaxID=2067455 RepID=UPI000C7DD800|nr:hypothetical protein [Novosphingobium sp. TH158]PLK26593.1 hypothetical protein C0V78_06580 [Novosphingobium sp. TH158]
MEVRPEIAALQAEPVRQVQAQAGLTAALASWQEGAEARPVLAGFSRYARGAPLAEQRALADLFGADGDSARALVAPLIDAFSRELAREPLGIVPLRHFADGMMASLMLAREADCLLTLVAIDGAGLAARPKPRSAGFAPAEEWEVVIAGSGRARLVERCGDRIATHGIDLSPGLALGRDGAREALIFDDVDGVLLMLRLQRRHDLMQPKLEVSLEDGRVLHRANATPQESRLEVAVALLGRMGRADAAPVLAEIARDESHGDSLRWQALRECLGLDTRTGFWTLTAIARAGSDALAIPAGALRAQLLETYPQLAEVDPCPA